MAVAIREACSADDYAAFGRLVRQYVEWCRERYADKPRLVEMAFGYQDLDRELERLAASYGPPKGKTLLAVDADGAVQGCVAYRSLGDCVCEMKRMFVPAQFHGQGLGRRLCEALIETATADGFTLMRLDTASGMDEAIAMYRSQGFAPCAPYIDYPDRLTAMILFMDRKL
ncbi:MAG: GNAT family N-acetyltransferase [Alphaproteobacteria bacterium]